jgi:hypothetical protein
MAKGSEAKTNVIQRIQSAFGSDFIGEFDKKIYVWSTEAGERVQVALTLTCPKVPVGAINQSTSLDFENPVVTEAAPTVFEPAEFTAKERKTVEELMKALGL